ncbi:thiamine pyrophosphate-dependent enzyme [Candidatus Riflebacteria bacterium]
MKNIFRKPESLAEKQPHYCPGCGHGIIHRIIGEVMDEFGIREKTIGVAPVGCSVFAYDYFNCDFSQAAHGRAPAVATGIKRADPEKIVFAYQGDGDLAAIGTAEIVHAANRGENITVVFVNNAIYGMTGGQMAPTSIPGQKTLTSPYGRDVKIAGNPILISEMLSTLNGPAYIERTTIYNVKNIKKTKRAIKKAFDYQIRGLGFSMVEVVSTCPTCWGINPVDSMEWLKDNMLPCFPLGLYKDIEKEAKKDE